MISVNNLPQILCTMFICSFELNSVCYTLPPIPKSGHGNYELKPVSIWQISKIISSRLPASQHKSAQKKVRRHFLLQHANHADLNLCRTLHMVWGVGQFKFEVLCDFCTKTTNFYNFFTKILFFNVTPLRNVSFHHEWYQIQGRGVSFTMISI